MQQPGHASFEIGPVGPFPEHRYCTLVRGPSDRAQGDRNPMKCRDWDLETEPALTRVRMERLGAALLLAGPPRKGHLRLRLLAGHQRHRHKHAHHGARGRGAHLFRPHLR